MRILIIILLCFTSPAFGQQTVKERVDMKLRSIKKITETRFEMQDGRWSSGTPYGYKEYDREGNLIVNGRYGNDGKEYAMYVRRYKENKCYERLWFCNRTEENPEGEPCLQFKDYKFDPQGNVTEEVGYDMEGNFAARVKFIRNRQGNPTERWDYLPDTSDWKYYTYQYNTFGDATEEAVYNEAGDMISRMRYAYRYNDNGTIKEVRWYSHDLTFGKTIYEYSGRNIQEAVSVNNAGHPLFKKVYTYENYPD